MVLMIASHTFQLAAMFTFPSYILQQLISHLSIPRKVPARWLRAVHQTREAASYFGGLIPMWQSLGLL